MSDEVVRFGIVSRVFGTLIRIFDGQNDAVDYAAYLNGSRSPAPFRVVEIVGLNLRVGNEITKKTEATGTVRVG